MKNILIAEDQVMVRQGLKMMIEMDESFKVIAEAENGQEAVDLCEKVDVDLALLDIRMPVMNGLQASKQIKEKHPEMKLLILTTFNDEDYAMEALKNKVDGYLLKDGNSEELLNAIHCCFEGGLILGSQVAAKVMPSLIQEATPSLEIEESLTEREKSILAEIAKGSNNQEIAQSLFLSVGTVKNHITVILDKLELRDRTQLAIYAIKHGIDKKSD